MDEIEINELRPGVIKAAQLMERVLRAHDDKIGWKKSSNHYLINKVFDNTDELANLWLDIEYNVKGSLNGSTDFLLTNDSAIKLIDVMNYCMMLLDNMNNEIKL